LNTLGLIAGGGSLPLEIAKEAGRIGLKLVVIAHEGETDLEISKHCQVCHWIKLGQFGRLIEHLKSHNIKQAIMAGSIRKRRMFEGVRPDLKGLGIMLRLKIFHDDAILRAVSEELEKEGIQIISCTQIMPSLLVEEGVFTKKGPKRSQEEDISLGLMVAKEIGRLDIGQTVVVKDRVVVAVEALEGTDETIKRGASLAPNAVVVKVAKPQQDLRFDLPTIGPRTVQVMAESKAALLCVEAGKTILLDKKETISLANRFGLVVMARRLV